jgi:hypothetical protein
VDVVSEQRCECCDLPVSSCGKAAEAVQRQQLMAERALLLAAGWFPARWAGECAGCGYWFKMGALIRRDGEDWRSECCSDGAVVGSGRSR